MSLDNSKILLFCNSIFVNSSFKKLSSARIESHDFSGSCYGQGRATLIDQLEL